MKKQDIYRYTIVQALKRGGDKMHGMVIYQEYIKGLESSIVGYEIKRESKGIQGIQEVTRDIRDIMYLDEILKGVGGESVFVKDRGFVVEKVEVPQDYAQFVVMHGMESIIDIEDAYDIENKVIQNTRALLSDKDVAYDELGMGSLEFEEDGNTLESIVTGDGMDVLEELFTQMQQLARVDKAVKQEEEYQETEQIKEEILKKREEEAQAHIPDISEYLYPEVEGEIDMSGFILEEDSSEDQEEIEVGGFLETDEVGLEDKTKEEKDIEDPEDPESEVIDGGLVMYEWGSTNESEDDLGGFGGGVAGEVSWGIEGVEKEVIDDNEKEDIDDNEKEDIELEDIELEDIELEDIELEDIELEDIEFDELEDITYRDTEETQSSDGGYGEYGLLDDIYGEEEFIGDVYTEKAEEGPESYKAGIEESLDFFLQDVETPGMTVSEGKLLDIDGVTAIDEALIRMILGVTDKIPRGIDAIKRIMKSLVEEDEEYEEDYVYEGIQEEGEGVSYD